MSERVVRAFGPAASGGRAGAGGPELCNKSGPPRLTPLGDSPPRQLVTRFPGGILDPPSVAFSEYLMAPRANWKGFLRLSLVTCPVALYPATSDTEKVSFNQINRKTGHGIKNAK